MINSHSNVIMFADDTSILIYKNNHDELNLNFKSVLSQILKWFQASQLILDIEKTSLVKFTHPPDLLYIH
jgi:hypothetical protein